MHYEDIEPVLQSLNQNNATMLFFEENTDISNFINQYKKVGAISKKTIINVTCAKAINFNDMSSMIYTEFLRKLSENIRFDKLSSHSYNIENKLISFIQQEQNSALSYDHFTMFEILLDEIVRVIQEEEIQMLLILNDFEYLIQNENFNIEDLWKLRSKLQDNKVFSLLVTTKDESLLKMNRNNPFFGYFKSIKVATDNDLYFYTKDKLRNFGLDIDKSLLDYLINKLDNDSIQIRAFLKIVQANTEMPKFSEINYLDIEQISQYIEEFTSYNELYYNALLRNLHSIKHGLYVFKNIVFEVNKNKYILRISMFEQLEKDRNLSSQNYSRIVKKLTKEGYLKKIDRGKYIPKVSLFGDYIVEKITKKSIVDDINIYLRRGGW